MNITQLWQGLYIRHDAQIGAIMYPGDTVAAIDQVATAEAEETVLLMIRIWSKEDESMIAVFPYEPVTMDSDLCSVYTPISGWSSADYKTLIRATIPAVSPLFDSDPEYLDIIAALTLQGINFEILHSTPRSSDAKRTRAKYIKAGDYALSS